MKKISNIIAKARLLTMMMVAVAALAACSDDDDNIVREGLTQNGITLTSSTVSALNFSWEKVDNAVQYGYRLLDTDSTVVDGGVTTGTTASFTGLDDDTEYIFELTSFAEYNSKYKNADAKYINVKTEKIIVLDTPSITATVEYEKVSVSWDAVENADKYYVKVTDSNDSTYTETTTSTSYSFNGTVGLTYSVSVSADTDAEAYSQSEWATASDLTPEKSPKFEVWRVTGTMSDQAIYKASYTRTMIAYSDGTYVIEDYLYGGTGCNLEFKVNSDKTIDIQNGTYNSSTGMYAVEYYPGYNAYIYPWYYDPYYYSYFDSEAGSVYFYASDDYGNTGYCTFTWNPEDVNVDWIVTGRFIDSTIYGTTSATSEAERTMIAYKDGSYKIVNWLDGGDGYDFEFTPQADGSLGVKNSTDGGYYATIEFYPGYYVYLYPGSGYWGLETDTEECEFWISAYYSYSGYFQFKWNKSDAINY